ncbi:ROK family transcriptional regulator [Paenibacillus rubinfantis]|uniref:ROK family transcriptional regulator n=1 Tax=Paenibacillus rubinfantis TaxID=1720296 RepID=UPI00073F9C40|nr:ROK family protein [Paenibacillus rubinfantis]
MTELPATPKDMKQLIHSGIRSTLLALGSATKAELSAKLGVSFPTVSKFLAEMKDTGEIAVVGMDNSSGGRRAERYEYNPEYMLGLAVFLERTESNYIVYNCRGEVKDEGRGPCLLTDAGDSLAELIEECIRRFPQIRSLAIGVPGAVNQGRIIHIPDYEALQHFDLKGALERRFGLPTAVENDMNAAVMGYSRSLDSSDNPSLVYLYFGQNGPGAGILINGDVVRGNTFFSGEVSYVPQYEERNFGQALQTRPPKGPGYARVGEAGADAVSRLIAACTAIINPHTVVFCHDEVSVSLLNDIKAKSAQYVPAEHLPRLMMSDWRRDYLNGLTHLGLTLMI